MSEEEFLEMDWVQLENAMQFVPKDVYESMCIEKSKSDGIKIGHMRYK